MKCGCAVLVWGCGRGGGARRSPPPGALQRSRAAPQGCPLLIAPGGRQVLGGGLKRATVGSRAERGDADT